MTEDRLKKWQEKLRQSLCGTGRAGRLSAPDSYGLADVVVALPVRGQLLEFYEVADPEDVSIPWFVEWLHLFPLAELILSQEGFRSPIGKAQTLLPGWSPSWIAVGEVGGDPVIVDTAVAECPVLMANHGAGPWDAKLVAPSLGDFLRLLVAWLKLWHQEGGDVRSSDGSLKASVVDGIESTVTAHLPLQHRVNFLSFVG